MVLHPGVIPPKGRLEAPKTRPSWGTRLPRAPIHSAFRAQNIQLQTQLLHHRLPSPGTAPSGCSRTRRCCRNISAFQHLSATSPSPELGWEHKFTLLYPIPMLLTMQRLRVSRQGGERWPSPVPWHRGRARAGEGGGGAGAGFCCDEPRGSVSEIGIFNLYSDMSHLGPWHLGKASSLQLSKTLICISLPRLLLEISSSGRWDGGWRKKNRRRGRESINSSCTGPETATGLPRRFARELLPIWAQPGLPCAEITEFGAAAGRCKWQEGAGVAAPAGSHGRGQLREHS